MFIKLHTAGARARGGGGGLDGGSRGAEAAAVRGGDGGQSPARRAAHGGARRHRRRCGAGRPPEDPEVGGSTGHGCVGAGGAGARWRVGALANP
eukprot:SAG31_NODE_1095_length_9928_cov_5.441042_5_plen_94_part_00